MSYAVWLSISFVTLATVSFVYWAASRTASLIQSTIKAATEMQTERPITLSKLGDSLDALQIAMREIDTKAERTLSLARSNRARITNLQHRGEGEIGEPGESPVAPVPQPRAVRLPGRTD